MSSDPSARSLGQRWARSCPVAGSSLSQAWSWVLLRQHRGVLCDFGEGSLFLWSSVFLSSKWKGLDLISECLFELGHSLWVIGHQTVGRSLDKVPWQSLTQKFGPFSLCSCTPRDEELITSWFFWVFGVFFFLTANIFFFFLIL